MKKTTRTTSLSRSLLSQNQLDAVTRLTATRYTLLYAKMGAGKTVTALTAIQQLFADNYLTRVLIIAPLKVCNEVWRYEHTRWKHLEHLHVSIATGAVKKRIEAIESNSDICVINIENVSWFFDTYRHQHGFDGLVIDELSRFKTPSGQQFKRLRHRLNDFDWRVGMTGTPVSENYQALYGQALLIDGGKALGKSKEQFLNAYFFAIDFERRLWELKPSGAERITARLKSLIHHLPDYRDSLPDIHYHRNVFTLSTAARKIYQDMKKGFCLGLGNDKTIIAQNSAVLVNKLQQIANGFIYDTDDKTVTKIHDERLTALTLLLNQIEGPVLIAYWYGFEREQIAKRFKAPHIGAGVSNKKVNQLVRDWNMGHIQTLLIHPRSAGHGLNLQYGGSTLIWYAPQWSRDLHEQTIARLWRQGQVQEVNVYTLVAKNTIDEIIEKRLESKALFDQLLQEHLQS